MKRKIICLFLSTLLILSFTSTSIVVCATESTSETTSETEGEGYNLFGEISNNIANAKIDEENLAEANEDIYGNSNFNPLENAKNSIKKFVDSLRNKPHDLEDFNGEADSIYDAAADGAEEVVDSGFLDTLYNFGKSVVKFITNIFSSIGDAIAGN